MKRLGTWIAANVQPMAVSLSMTVLVAALLWFGLGSLVVGMGSGEASYIAQTSSVQALTDNPLGLPHKALQLGLRQIDQSSIFALRSASALMGLLAIASFYYILSHWYTRRVALLGTLLFASSAWFLHTSRLATDASMYMLLIVPVACVAWLQKTKGGKLAILVSAVAVVSLLYIPGMIWFVVPALLWQAGRIGRILEGQNVPILVLLTLLVMMAVAPLGWAFYEHQDLVKTYFGLPQALPDPWTALKNLGQVPVQLFWQGPDNPEVWLARLPLLDWFAMVMAVIGVYAHLFKQRLDRTSFIVYALVVGSLLVALGGSVNLSILLPFIYLLATAGVAHMLQQWFTVFPRNPFAHSIGATLMTIAVLATAFYNVNHYFVAWPNTPATKQTFIHRP